MAEQKVAIIAQDKSYLNKQVEQLNQAKLLNERKIEDLTQQLADTRHSKELLFDKFVNVRLVVIILNHYNLSVQGDAENRV